MQNGGMLATHRHETILGGSRVERLLSNAAEQRAAEVDSELGPSRPLRRSSASRQMARADAPANGHEPRARAVVTSAASSQSLSAVALLAAWKHVTVEQMARTLLDMTVEERTLLREQYAGV